MSKLEAVRNPPFLFSVVFTLAKCLYSITIATLCDWRTGYLLLGYGNYAPVTDGGRLFCVVFALTGIPLNFWLLKLIGEHMLNGEKLAITKVEMKLFNRQPRYLAEKCVLVAVAVVLIVILIGAAIQTSDEYWSFLHGVYFFVITLTTVGFGDLIPSHSLMSMKIFKILYSYFGLCVMSNILNGAFQVQESILFLKSKCRGLTQRAMIVNEEIGVAAEDYVIILESHDHHNKWSSNEHY